MVSLTPDRTAAYIRVSTDRQRPDSQRAELTFWLERHGLSPQAVQWFEDQETGRTLARPALGRLQRAIFAGDVDTVVVWKLDRLARSLRDGVNILGDWLTHGARVIVTTQQIDLTGPVGQLVSSLLFGLAEIELQYQKERQAAGIALAKQRGVYTGRKQGTTKASPARARELRAKGLTVREIAQALNTAERTAYNYLRALP